MNKLLQKVVLSALLMISFCGAFAQNVGSILLFDSYFQSQLYNPAYFSNPKYPVIGVPLLGNSNITNSANFRLSNFIYKNSDNGEMQFDFEKFDQYPNKLYQQINTLELLPLYFNIKIKEHNVGFYYKESLYSMIRTKGNALSFLNNGNAPELYRNFSSEKMWINELSFKEFAVNLTKELNEKITIGYRPKLVFGITNISINNLEYNIKTSQDGDSISLTSYGEGKVSAPFEIIRDEKKTIYKINGENAMSKYLGAFSNWGLALDLGMVYKLSDSEDLSFSMLNLGFIKFTKKSYELDFNKSYLYKGFNINIDERSEDYVDRLKEELLDAIRPDGDYDDYVKMLPLSLILNYNKLVNDKVKIGATNQLLFFGKQILNTTSFASKYNIKMFDLVGNVNVYNFRRVSIGGGVSLQTKYLQMFFLANNLAGIYHPAITQNFSFNVGVQITINPERKSFFGSSGGKFSKTLPFYRNKH